MTRWLLMTAAGVAVFASAGCTVDRKAQEQAKRTEAIVTDQTPVVAVQPARIESVSEELEITGDIVTGEDAAIGAKQPGKITAVYVKEGDSVRAGQLLATLDASQLYAQLRQAQAQVATANAGMNAATSQLAQARRNAAAGPQRTTSAVRSAEAQLRSAKAQLQKAESGARPQEIRQAEAALAAARANLTTQQKELERVEVLVREGALAGNRLDQQRNAVQSAQAQFDNAQEALNLAKEGARPEDISSAREAVRQAEEAVRSAKVQKDLDPLLKDQVRSAEAQVDSARSQLDAARANVSIVQQSIEDMQIRAPFSGRVLGKPVQPGTIASGGTSIVRLVGGTGAYFNGQIPASEVDRVSAGMPVEIRVDGLAGKVFVGSVSSVSPVGESVGRLFTAQVNFNGAPFGVKPGMFARGTIKLKTIQNATMVPIDAVVTRGTSKFIYYVDGGVAKETPVTTGVRRDAWIQVTGVPSAAQVVVDGQTKLRDGVKVTVQEERSSTATAENDRPQESGI